MTNPRQAIEAAAKAIADEIGHGMSEKCFDHARAALTAAAPHMSGVKVKQLEWEQYEEKSHGDNIKLFWRANSLNGGRYWIEMHHTETGYNGRCVYGGMTFATEEEAKSFAQADFEKRFWAMADVTAMEPSSARDQALEEAAKVADRLEENLLQKHGITGNPFIRNTIRAEKSVAIQISTAIRALKSQPAPQTGGGE